MLLLTTRTSSSSRHAFSRHAFSRLQRLDTGSSISLFPRAFTRSKGSSISPRPSDSKSWRSPISHSNRASSRLDKGSSISLFPRAFTRSKGSSISPRPSDSESWRSPISHSNRASSIPTGSAISLRQHSHLRSQDAFRKQTVVNLSQRTLTPIETSVLSLGMNFALTPKYIPTEEIIQSVEPALRRLNKTAADDVRLQMSDVLCKARPAKPNLSKGKLSALRDIRRDSSIHILTADKGNATVIIDRSQYTDKVSHILLSDSYRPLKKNPIPFIEKRVASKLLALHRAGALSIQLYRHLRLSS